MPTTVVPGIHGVETAAELGSEPTSAESESAALPLLPTFGEVVEDYFQHLAGNSQHLFSC